MKKDLEKLKSFAKIIGINEVVESINFIGGPTFDCFIYPQNIICLYKDNPIEQKIISLAHEIGHFINYTKHDLEVEICEIAEEKIKQFPQHRIEISFYHSGLCRDIRINAHIAILKEETLAWHEAEQILKFLKIKVNHKKWENEKKKNLETYKLSYKKNLKLKKLQHFSLNFEEG